MNQQYACQGYQAAKLSGSSNMEKLKKRDTELILPAGLLVKVPVSPQVQLPSPRALVDMHNTNLLILGWAPPLSGALILGSFQG